MDATDAQPAHVGPASLAGTAVVPPPGNGGAAVPAHHFIGAVGRAPGVTAVVGVSVLLALVL